MKGGADDWLKGILMGWWIEGGWSLGLVLVGVVPLILQAAICGLV